MHQIAGSDDQTGTVILKSVATGASRSDLSLSSGTFSEVHVPTGNTPQGTWAGPDGVSNPIAYHNLISEPAWSTPAILLAGRLADVTGVFCTSGSEREFTLEGSWYADEKPVLPISIIGFRDEQDGTISAREMTTDALEPAKIINGEVPGWGDILDKKPIECFIRFGVSQTLSQTAEELKEMGGGR